MQKIVRTLIVLTALLLVATPAAAQPPTGPTFGTMVALGDSLTAGFLNGGLIDEAQERSYPALIHEASGSPQPFEQPLVGPPGIPPLLEIKSLAGGLPVIAPRAGNPGPPLNLNLQRPYNNLAVPGFTVVEALNVTSDPANPLSDLVLRNIAPMWQQGLSLRPNFVTVWLGNNDVLGAATSGIVLEGVTYTPIPQFRQAYRTIVGAFAGQQNAPDMAIANIPDVTALPFVTTVPPVVVNPATGQPVTGPDGNPVFLIGEDGPLTPDAKVLLTATSLLAQGIGIPAQLGGTGQPLPDNAYLSRREVATITALVAAYNDVIAQAAADFGVALVDINGFFNDVVAHGYGAGGGLVLTPEFLTGGIFSYDGVHPTPIGYAVVANLFIEAINAHYDGSLPLVDLFPFLFGPDGSAGATIPLPGLGEDTPVFSNAAYEALRMSMGTPPTQELLRIRDERQKRPDTGGDAPRLGLDSPKRPTLGLSIGQ